MVSTIRRWIRSAADIRRDEYRSVMIMFGYGFLLMTSYYVIKPARNSIFVERVGADALPWVYILTALVVLVVMVGYSRLVDRVGRLTLILSSMGALAGLLVLFWWLLGGGDSGLVGSGAFYVFTKLYPLFLVSQFWLVANLLFTTTQARRLFGLIGVGLILGGISGSTIAGFGAQWIGTESLLLVAVGILGLCALLVLVLSPRIRAAGSETSGRLTEEISGGAVALLRKSDHLKTIAVILALTVVVGTLLDWQLNRAVELFVQGEDAKTEFFGAFYGTLNVVSVLVQAVFTGFVLRRLGVGVALLLLPVALAVASGVIVLLPILWVVAAAKGAEGALRYSLDQSTRELLFLPVPTEVKYKVKPLIDLAIYRGGTGLGGVLLLVFVNGLGLPLRWVSLVTLGVILLWLAAAIRMRKEFARSLRNLIGARDVRLEELVVQHLGAETISQLRTVLRTGTEDEIRYALALLANAPDPRLVEDVDELLNHPSAEVRGRALEVLTRLDSTRVESHAASMLKDESVEVRMTAIHYLCDVSATGPAAAMQEFLDDADERIRVGAVGCLIRHGGGEQKSRGMELLTVMARHSDPSRREAAARLLGHFESLPDGARELLGELARDNHFAVGRAAMESVGRTRESALLPFLMDRFRDPFHRESAAAALRAFGPEVHPSLMEILEEPGEPLSARIGVPELLVPDAGQPVVERLWECLPQLDPWIRYHALRALNQLRRAREDLSFEGFEPDALFRQELSSAGRWLVVRHDLGDGAAAEPGARNDGSLLDRALRQRQDEAVERAIRTLALQVPAGDAYAAFKALSSSEQVNRQRGFELLDALIPVRYRTWVDPLLNPDAEAEPRVATVRQTFQVQRKEPRSILLELSEGDDLHLAVLAHRALGRPGLPRSCVRERLQQWIIAEGPLGGTIDIPVNEDGFMEVLERGEAIRKAKIFRDLRIEELAAVAALTQERTFETDDVVFPEGAPGQALYVVVDGRIRASKGDRTLFEAGPGRTVGSLSLLDGLPTDYQATALEPTRTLRLERQPFLRLLKERDQAVLQVLEYLTGVVRGLNESPNG